MNKKEKKYAIDTLEELIDEYVVNFHCGNGLADEKNEEQLFGMVRYARFIDVITAGQCEYYKRCVRRHIYIGD